MTSQLTDVNEQAIVKKIEFVEIPICMSHENKEPSEVSICPRVYTKLLKKSWEETL